MKLIRHKITATSENGIHTLSHYFNTEEEALRQIHQHAQYGMRYVYNGPVEIDLYCESCNKDLKPGDQYIRGDEHTRYCADCYETEVRTVHLYTVGGAFLGIDEDGITEFDADDIEEGEIRS